MPYCLLDHQPTDAIPLQLVEEHRFSQWVQEQPEFLRRWVNSMNFKAKPNTICAIPTDHGAVSTVLAGLSAAEDPWALGKLPALLPPGNYFLNTDQDPALLERLLIGWGLGTYRFARYKKAQPSRARLAIPSACNALSIEQQLRALYEVRDLINTPAEDMLPEQLAEAVFALGAEFSAPVEQITGEALLNNNFPLIHAVGRASTNRPRLLDLRWGDPNHPKITLVGKGVCFDSGGLNLKPTSGMRLMKKDMGGAAHAIGLARLIISAGLPVRLRLLVAAVENAVAGNALRPGDVVRSRKGLTVEIDNTDAEGRLILCDALAEGVAEEPDMVLDFATLTGAARSALGTEIPALFCNSDQLANGLAAAAEQEHDPIWRLPLHKPYRKMLDSKVADIANSAKAPYAGAITAALFLQEFVPQAIPWAHFDLMAWNTKTQPGRPEGGEAMGLRAVFAYLRQRFGSSSTA